MRATRPLYLLALVLFCFDAPYSYSQLRVDSTDTVYTLDTFTVRATPPGEKVPLGGISGAIPYNGGVLSKDFPGPGVFTFTTEFFLASSLVDLRLGLGIGPLDYPVDLYLNGKLLGSRGVHREGKYISAVHNAHAELLPPTLLNYGGVNTLVVQAFPLFETAPLSDLHLGSLEDVNTLTFWRNFVNVDLLKIAVVFSLLMGVYILALYFVGARDRSYLDFSLLCIFFSLGFIGTMFSYDNRNEVLLEKLTRIGLVLVGSMMNVFIMNFTGLLKGRVKAIVEYLIYGITALALILIGIQGNKAGYVGVFNSFLSFYVMPSVLFSLILAWMRLSKTREIKNVLVALGMTMVIAAAIHDAYYSVTSLIPYVWLVAHGFLCLIAAIFIVIVIDQQQQYLTATRQSKRLNNSLSSLEAMVDKITEVSEHLRQSGIQLASTFRSSIQVLEEYRGGNRVMQETVMEKMTVVGEVLDRFKSRIRISAEQIPHSIAGQTVAVEQISASVNNMNLNMEHTAEAMGTTNLRSRELVDTALGGRDVINRSSKAIVSLGEYARIINEVMGAIEDLTARTRILAINAAIEAARAGNHGKGFAVIAGEIGSLSDKSQVSLESSFQKLTEMNQLIAQSAELSKDVDSSLGLIMGRAQESAEKVEDATRRVTEQKREQDLVLQSVESLLKDTLNIKSVTDAEAKESQEVASELDRLLESFRVIQDTIEAQAVRGEKLSTEIAGIRGILDVNQGNLDSLAACVKDTEAVMEA